MNRIGVSKLGVIARGGRNQVVNPVLPQPASIVRAYSIRRLIAEFGNGIVGYADRDTPIGGTPDNGFPLTFNDSGLISVADGIPAFLYSLIDQKSNTASVINKIFSSCPRIFDGTTIETGIKLNPGSALRHLRGASADTELDTVTGGNVTISLWFKTSVETSSAYMFSLNNASPGRFYAFRVQTVTGTKKITMFCGALASVISFNTSYDDNTWHCITMSCSGSNVLVYYDGVQAVSIANRTIADAAGVTTIGGTSATGQFSGDVNDIVIWSAALTGDEMTAHYNATKAYYGII